MRMRGVGEQKSVLELFERETGRMRRHLGLLALGWSLAVVVSLYWNLVRVRRGTEESARTEARTAFNRDVLYRRWNAGNGGVYVPVTGQTPPNPYLDAHERDIQTPGGQQLTLVNPAYMTRKAHELGARDFGILGHITALNTIRPENAADPWETRAVRSEESLGELVAQTVDLVSSVLRHDQIALSMDVAEDLPKVLCRKQQIRQVILNLLTNARDSLNTKCPGYDENKRIAIRARRMPVDGGTFVRLTIEDAGEGMGPDTKLHVFDPFFTTKDRSTGSGLGLSVSYGIVKEHGGYMSVETEPGIYARFHVDLPTADSGQSGAAG